MNKKGFVPDLRSFPQDHTSLMAIGLLLAFLISACGNTTPIPSAESVIDGVQTAVAATVSAPAIISANPTATLLPTATPTAYIIPTTIQATATSQVWYWTSSIYYGCEDSDFINDLSIPDGTVLTPGETFVKTWKFKNIGNCAWSSDFSMVFIDGDEMDGSNTTIDTEVYADKKVDVSVSLTAPDDEGTYLGYWQLADGYGNAFGDLVYVEIVVSEATATDTPTSTPTSTPTPTHTSSVTSTPASSLTPTSTDIPKASDTPISTTTPTVIPSTLTPSAVPVGTDTPLPAEVPAE